MDFSLGLGLSIVSVKPGERVVDPRLERYASYVTYRLHPARVAAALALAPSDVTVM